MKEGVELERRWADHLAIFNLSFLVEHAPGLQSAIQFQALPDMAVLDFDKRNEKLVILESLPVDKIMFD